MEVGVRVKVVSTSEMCCGVLMQGNTSTIDCIMNAFHPVNKKESQIAILRDGSIHWIVDLEKV